MAEYRYYLIPDFMSHVFPQQFEEQAPTEFFSNTADLMKRYQQLREMPYNNEYTWNERTNLPYPRLTVGIDRRDPDGAVTIMQVRSGVNYLCDDYRGPFADRNDKQLLEMAKVGVKMPKPQDIFQLAQQEAVRVTASPQAWQSFLYTAAHNYHTTYLNQLLIHAQRPDAAACASMPAWSGSLPFGKRQRRSAPRR